MRANIAPTSSWVQTPASQRVARKPEPRSLCWKWPLGRWGSGPVSDCALLRREPGRPLLVAKPHSAAVLPLGLNAKPAPRTTRGSGEDTEDRQVGQPRTGTCGRGQARAPGPGPQSRLPASQAGRGACGRSENTLKIRTLQSSPENRLGAEITQQSHSMLRGPSRVLPGPQTRQRVSVHVKRDTSHTVSRRSGHPAPDRQLRVACSAAQQRPPPPARCSAWGQGSLSVGTLSTRVPGAAPRGQSTVLPEVPPATTAS